MRSEEFTENWMAKRFATKMSKLQMIIFFGIIDKLGIKTDRPAADLSDMDTEHSYPYVTIDEDRFASRHSCLGENFAMLPFGEFIDRLIQTQCIKVRLNDQYTAEIKDGKVVVGCQTFEFSAIDELYNAIHK